MILAAVVLLLLTVTLWWLNAAHRAPVTGLDDSLAVVDAAIDAPPVERKAAA